MPLKLRHRSLCAAALVAVGVLPSACGKLATEDKRSGDLDPKLEAVETTAIVKSDSQGVVQAVLKTSSMNTQIIKAKAGSAIAGAELAFLPFSFDIDYDVALEEGKSIATKKNLTKLGFPATTVIESAGPAIVVSWTYDYDTQRPYTITMPVPAPGSGLQTQSAGAMAVLFLKNVADSDSNKLGLVSAKRYTLNGATLTFPSSSFGVYQVVRLATQSVAPDGSTTTTTEPVVIDEPQEVVTDELVETVVPPSNPVPGIAPGPETPAPGPEVPATTPPEAFVITTPDVVEDAGRFFGLATKIRWEKSTGASGYEVRLDPVDPKCANATNTSGDLAKVLTATVQPAQGGDQYVCVFAKNAAGTTAATNSGILIKADIQPPPKPNAPVGSGATLTAQVARWNWDVGTDEGPAGFQAYEFEVRTAGGTIIIPEARSSKNSDNHAAQDGESYIGRVRLIDRAGNVSAWSDDSAPLKANTE